MSDLCETPHDPAAWAEFETQIDEQRARFDGLPYAEVTEDTRTEVLAMVAEHVRQLHLVVKALALEGQSKRTRAPRVRKEVEGG